MNKVILMSIRPELLVKILNGEKTLELRKNIPADFENIIKKQGGIWVNIYVTNALPFLIDYHGEYILSPKHLWGLKELNGKVVARFWFDTYYKCTFNYEFYEFNCPNDDYKMFLSDLCLTHDEVLTYGKASEYRPDIEPIYAWHIKNLEIFDKPKDLWDFHTRHDMLFLGRMMAKKVFQFESVNKAPKNWQYVYKEE